MFGGELSSVICKPVLPVFEEIINEEGEAKCFPFGTQPPFQTTAGVRCIPL